MDWEENVCVRVCVLVLIATAHERVCGDAKLNASWITKRPFRPSVTRSLNSLGFVSSSVITENPHRELLYHLTGYRPALSASSLIRQQVNRLNSLGKTLGI